ncbi:MAG TPA: N-acyl homoserine lactonase family protein [Actinokineospora sp.]|nr:N-acyl homoserine lactonase family protein [Actinokineospora sp.]
MRLYLLELGHIGHDWAAGGRMPVCAYLIQTADATVLVDTGFPPDAPPGAIQVTPEQELITQLSQIGVNPGDITHVICSHLDPDHAGNHDLFPQAEFVIQRSHYELAMSDTVPRLRMARKHWDQENLNYRQIDGDIELLPGVELIESSGHILGHQSVLVRLPESGPVLLAIDAITMEKALDPDTRPMTNYDLEPELVRSSTRKLVDLAAKEGALIVRGHDGSQWETLKRAPEFYA